MKLRYWDNYDKKMLQSDEIFVWNNNFYGNEAQKLLKRIIDKKGLLGRSLHNDYIMEGSTLADKNNKPIFEQDICYDSEEKEFGLVLKENGCFWFKTKNKKELLYQVTHNLEIRGNIYENEDLLPTE